MNTLRYAALATGIALVAAACGTPAVTVNPVVGQSSTGLPPGISVTGSGEVEGAPDTLTMMFGVSVLRPTVSEAVGEAASKAEAAITALTNQGVAEDDIQTANYSIYPEYDYRDTGQQLLGYRVENTVTAKIRDLETAGNVIDAVSAAGGDEVRVGGVSFSIEDDEALLQAARQAAWADARAKAVELATLAGVTLGDPMAISETLVGLPPIYYPEARGLEGDAAALTPIQPGQQTVTVTLSVEFAIES